MPRLTVVIPALGAVDALENSLVSVLEHRPPSCDVLVALTRPYSDPYELNGEVRFLQTSRGVDAWECVRRGVAAAESELVFVLMAGCEVTAGWADRALKHFANPRVAAVTPRIVSAADRGQTLCNGVRLWPGGKRGLHVAAPPQGDDLFNGVWGPSLAAAFYRVAALKAVDAFAAPHGGPLADAQLAASFHRGRWLVAWERTSIVTADAASLAVRGGRLSEAWHAQRLAVTSADLFSGRQSLGGLARQTFGEFVRSLPSPMAAALLAVRLGALVGARRQMPSPAAPAVAVASPGEPAFRRVDRSQGFERRESAGQPLRRK